jgi:hypothetical protein
MTFQQPAPAPPAPPPAAPSGSGVGRVTVAGVPAPVTTADLATLRSRRSELSTQIQSATSRRNELARELRASLPNTADRAGLEARLQVLDQRIVQLEGDIAETGRLMALAPQTRTTITTTPRAPREAPRPPRDRAPLAMAFTLALLMPLAIGFGRRLWRGGDSPRRASAPVDQESRERLARLETAVDAIAIEMERVAEGQRFVTKLLTDATVAQSAVADAARRMALHRPSEPGQG